MNLSDQELLERYCQEKDEGSFQQLVERHIGLVHATALRTVGGDVHLAQDVAQVVFGDVALRAKSLLGCSTLAGWLHRHTFFTASKLVRSERRRQLREQETIKMQTPPPEAENQWKELGLLLDELINRLGQKDRDAVVLRFIQNQDFQAIAAALKTTEDAAQKRVARALERMRVMMSRKNPGLTVATLISVLAAGSAQTAPPGLAAMVTASSLSAAVTTSAGTITLLSAMTMTKMKIAAASALLIGGLTLPVMLHIYGPRPHPQEDSPGDETQLVTGLQKEGEHLPASNIDDAELQKLRNSHLELMRLRAQVGNLMRATNELGEALTALRNTAASGSDEAVAQATAVSEGFQPGRYYPFEEWSDAGTESAAAAIETYLWALDSGQLERFAELVFASPEEMSQWLAMLAQKPEGLSAHPAAGAMGVKVIGTEDLAPEDLAPGRIKFLCEFDYGPDHGKKRAHLITYEVQGGWKLEGNFIIEGGP